MNGGEFSVVLFPCFVILIISGMCSVDMEEPVLDSFKKLLNEEAKCRSDILTG